MSSHFLCMDTLTAGMRVDANYATENNFTGEIVSGYKSMKIFMATDPAFALCRVQKKLLESNLSLNIFDAYRPVKAVSFFQEWATRPESNLNLKARFYPKYSRSELFKEGYLSQSSSHSRGSAVDLTLYDLETEKNLDMGSDFDYFDEISHTDSQLITHEQHNNRQLLKKFMESEGFVNFSKEWWHYSFKPEPFPETFFDFNIE